VTAERLEDAAWKSLLLAPTKPLVQQHADFYREALTIPDDEIVVFTGDVRPDSRADLWEDARVVIATPQVVENDLVGNRISLADVVHCTFDECHRASGDYAYNYIAERYHADADDPLVTGMSASPGGDEEEILEVCENLGLNEVTVMTEADADVDEFTHDTDVQWGASAPRGSDRDPRRAQRGRERPPDQAEGTGRRLLDLAGRLRARHPGDASGVAQTDGQRPVRGGTAG